MLNKSISSFLRERGEEISADIISWRRILHKIPELRMDTPKTEAEIIRVLKEIGIEDIRAGVGGHGVCAVIRGEIPGKCLGIRTDCDGLPIKEETGLEFASTNGNMHACGHDAHTAMGLGAAKLIYEMRHVLKGTVKLIFQPYEEGCGGARLMINDGVLRSPDVEQIIGLHNHCEPDEDYLPGDILVTSEPITANVYSYVATFRGDTCHVCHSGAAANAVYMACEAVFRISKISEGNTQSVNAVTVVNGGVRNNIVPKTCTIEGSIRSFDRDEHTRMKEEVHRILEEAARAHGGEVTVTPSIDVMESRIDKGVYDNFCAVANEIFTERGCVQVKERELIGEDFAYYADMIPGLYFRLHDKPEGEYYPLHHSKFTVDESVLYKGSVMLAGYALMWQNERAAQSG